LVLTAISLLFSLVANPTAQTSFLGYSIRTTLFCLSSDLENVNLLGDIDELLKGPWDDYYDIIVKLEKIL